MLFDIVIIIVCTFFLFQLNSGVCYRILLSMREVFNCFSFIFMTSSGIYTKIAVIFSAYRITVPHHPNIIENVDK